MSLRNGCRRMRCLAILLYLVMACALPSLGEQSAPPPQKEAAVAVLFTNDVHFYYDRDIGYDGLMLYKKESWTVDPERLHGRSKNTPFKGLTLSAKVKLTISRGRIVYSDGV